MKRVTKRTGVLNRDLNPDECPWLIPDLDLGGMTASTEVVQYSDHIDFGQRDLVTVALPGNTGHEFPVPVNSVTWN